MGVVNAGVVKVGVVKVKIPVSVEEVESVCVLETEPVWVLEVVVVVVVVVEDVGLKQTLQSQHARSLQVKDQGVIASTNPAVTRSMSKNSQELVWALYAEALQPGRLLQMKAH